MESKIPVLIVGAGPVGLQMAVELQRYQIPFRIIDQTTKPVPFSNALAVQSRTLEIWSQLGIVDQALKLGNPIRHFQLNVDDNAFVDIDLKVLETDYPYILGLAQHHTEAILLEKLKSSSVKVEFVTKLNSILKNDNQVLVSVQHENHEDEIIAADWLIACDGCHSFVRTHLKVPFVGEELTQHFVIADVQMDSNLPRNQITGFLSVDGPLIIIPFDLNCYRIIAEVSHDAELRQAHSLTKEQLERLIHQRCPKKISIREISWTSGFWIHERKIPSFWHNRILFAGDAAHIHSPAGGQGMNTGIQDAHNLIWKLVLLIKGEVYDTILQSYQEERLFAANKVLRNSSRLTYMMSIHKPWLQKIRNLILKKMMGPVKYHLRLAKEITQISLRYPLSNYIVEDAAQLFGPQPGCRAPNVLIDTNIEKNNLYQYFDNLQHNLLIFIGSGADTDKDLLHKLSEKLKIYQGLINPILIIWSGKQKEFNSLVHHIISDKELNLHLRYGAKIPCLYLIRPDGHIAYRGLLSNQGSFLYYLKTIFVR